MSVETYSEEYWNLIRNRVFSILPDELFHMLLQYHYRDLETVRKFTNDILKREALSSSSLNKMDYGMNMGNCLHRVRKEINVRRQMIHHLIPEGYDDTTAKLSVEECDEILKYSSAFLDKRFPNCIETVRYIQFEHLLDKIPYYMSELPYDCLLDQNAPKDKIMTTSYLNPNLRESAIHDIKKNTLVYYYYTSKVNNIKIGKAVFVCSNIWIQSRKRTFYVFTDMFHLKVFVLFDKLPENLHLFPSENGGYFDNEIAVNDIKPGMFIRGSYDIESYEFYVKEKIAPGLYMVQFEELSEPIEYNFYLDPYNRYRHLKIIHKKESIYDHFDMDNIAEYDLLGTLIQVQLKFSSQFTAKNSLQKLCLLLAKGKIHYLLYDRNITISFRVYFSNTTTFKKKVYDVQKSLEVIFGEKINIKCNKEKLKVLFDMF